MSARRKHPPRVPIVIRGGIRAQSGRTLHSRPWWSRRWLDVIEGFRLGARLGRGRSYALAGQVAQLDLLPGCVSATIQGSSKLPYRAELRLRQLTEAGRRQVLAALRAHPILAARLLAGYLPPEIEHLFLEASCPLFPHRQEDIETRCSCPDWANPCKHLAAIYFLLGEAFDRDPFLLLALRGIERAELFLGARDMGAAGDEASSRSQVLPMRPGPEAHTASASAGSCEPIALPTDARAFWGDTLPPFDDYGPAFRQTGNAPLIQRLGALPFWRGEERFVPSMETVYSRAAPVGWRVWSGEADAVRRPLPPSDKTAGRILRSRPKMEVVW